MKYNNPILPGFNPDPCIIRHEDTYYVLTSTFETYPGINIYESKDLVNFKLISHPLTMDKIDMKNNTPSSGVWAPDITYANGMFYIVFSNMKHWARGPFKDSQNFIISSKDITGPWSKPIYINSSGFDASLFHDEDGKSYFVNMEWDFRNGGRINSFTGILVQEIDLTTMKLKGDVKKIFKGTDLGFVEGPHIYKKDGIYYLLCAEGGTGYTHAESVCRSKTLFGPYEVHPNKYLVTSINSDSKLQKAGHASLVESLNDGWFIAHLCGRPTNKKCILGRETALQNVVWKEGWPYLKSGLLTPSDTYELSSNIVKENKSINYKLPSKEFSLDFQSLRIDMSKYYKFSENKLIMEGHQSCSSFDTQMTLERRLTSFKASFGATIDYEPTSFQQMAGIMIRYQEGELFFLYITHDEKLGKVLRLFSQRDYQPTYYDEFILPIKSAVNMKVEINNQEAQFYYSTGNEYVKFGPILNIEDLCDEVVKLGGFTGTMLALHTCDMEYYNKKATFSNVFYKE